MIDNTKSKKVYVMMSGGVDSSVAALDLKEQGYDVIGVFMKCWSLDQLTALGVDEKLYGCFWEEDSRDARLVAHTLGIPFFVWDFQDVYKKSVVDYMIEEYRNGHTPNPDVMCNSAIKFGIFFDRAIQLGADFVATGHYARAGYTASGKSDNEIGVSFVEKNAVILRGKDTNKDQSYFLNRVLANRVDKILFPIGEYQSKADVRARALDHRLVTAQKKDSQGLCFIGETPLRELLIQTLGVHEGDIVSLDGEVLGRHPGAALYTIGQRNKLGLAGGPWFVARIDIITNTVIVAHQSQKQEINRDTLEAESINLFVNPDKLLQLLRNHQLSAQIRYRQTADTIADLEFTETGFRITFAHKVHAISPGQSVVIYNGDELVASGIITVSY